MPKKTIALSEESYNLLVEERRPGETFSEVVRRFLRPRIEDFLEGPPELSRREAEAMKRTILRRRRASALKRAPRTRRR